MTSALFTKFRANIAVSNAGDIATSYANISARLNKDFWDLRSDTAHRRQVGSYGRGTAIHGISDLDMVFEIRRWPCMSSIESARATAPRSFSKR